ncbi:type VI secretion system Vgr family protein [Vibrio sinaloensis]|uniref:type VI secretion system Vgr family protein n=1 Tax=Photobacterium sp. (strain ATCC 43367) TaxID=379097 RepID=UPI002063FE13|nr:type VI secretion system tip protein TssI/VgrG [Vibrio sinaloensis]UPQ89088.1 type VI secretion system tip protein VgrG [Vibrio sinaloensis]
MPTLNFNIQIEGLEPDTVRVVEYSGWDSLSNTDTENSQPCRGFRYQFQLASRLSSLSAEQIVDKSIQFEMVRDGQVVQRLNGIVYRFSKGDTGHHHTFYQVTVVPELERLSLRHNCRIFQYQSVPEIVSILLQEMNIQHYAFVLKNDHAQREFCVQYRESDLDFVQRLLAEEGIVYHHLHDQDKHTVVFTDSNDSLIKLEQPVPYNAMSGGNIEIPYINAFLSRFCSQVSHVQTQDYSFKKPAYRFTQNRTGTDMAYQIEDRYEHFDAPGRFKDDQSGKVLTSARLAYLRREAKTAQGHSNHPGLIAGAKFELQEHNDQSLNREWVVVAASHTGSQPQSLEEEGGVGATTYHNQFTVVPSDVVWQAEPTTKPRVDGPMIATVVGPEGEEIYCDEHGRVKVHFHWDRYSNADEHSSCWVRVSQGWAGHQYGMVALPRIGHEVIVTFLNGDPDQPIITGRTYHATNVAPYALPEHKTKTVIRSETYQGQGFNELSFEDQADKERVYLHAQKDIDIVINNDESSEIHHDKHHVVDNDHFSLVNNNSHLTIGGERREQVSADKSVNIGDSLQQKVGQKTAIDSGDEVHLKAGHKIVVDAGSAITIKAGGSFVKVDAGGVHVVGSAINLNSGGSPGSGSGYSGKAPVLPMGLEDAVAPEEMEQRRVASTKESMSPLLKSRQIEALKSAEPVCEVCEELNKDG